MAKPCCEPGDPNQKPAWKVWMKRVWYTILIVILLILLWNQLHANV